MFLLFHGFLSVRFEFGYLALDTRSDLLTVPQHALVALHVLGVHTSYAVVRTATTGMVMRILLHMVHELRIFDEHVRDLEQFEPFVHDLLTVIAALHTADINKGDW